jgi:hypothetical protein
MFTFFNTSTCLFFQVLKNQLETHVLRDCFFSKCVIWRALPTRFFNHNYFPLSLCLSPSLSLSIYIYIFIYIFYSFFPQSAGFFLLLLRVASFLFSIQTSWGLAKNKKKTFVIFCVLINLIFSFVNTLLSFLK